MKTNPAIRECIIAFLEENPASPMGDIIKHVLGKGMSTESGVPSVMRNLVAWGAVRVDRTKYKNFLYSVTEEARTVRHLPANRFEVPPELTGPRLPPMVWSMRHLLGVGA